MMKETSTQNAPVVAPDCCLGDIHQHCSSATISIVGIGDCSDMVLLQCDSIAIDVDMLTKNRGH